MNVNLKESWETYRAEAIQKDASPGRIMETRRGFYAGAIATFSLLCAASGQGGHHAGAVISAINAELKDFYESEIARTKSKTISS